MEPSVLTHAAPPHECIQCAGQPAIYHERTSHGSDRRHRGRQDRHLILVASTSDHPPFRSDVPTDFLEQCRELHGAQAHHTFRRRGPAEPSGLQTLAVQNQAGAVVDQDLHAVGAFGPEDEDFLRQTGRPAAPAAPAPPAIRRSMPFLKSTGCAASRILHPRRDRDHARSRSTSSTRRSAAASTSARSPAPPPGPMRPPSGLQARSGQCCPRSISTGTNAGPLIAATDLRAPLQLLAPDEKLARVQPVAPRHRRGGRRRIEALRHNPRLLLQAPSGAGSTTPGDHLKPAEAVCRSYYL